MKRLRLFCHRWQRSWRWLLGVLFVLGLGWVSAHAVPSAAFSEDWLVAQLPTTLPEPQAHPLPPALAGWQDARNSGDYFDRIKSVSVGYLIWSKFPITVYIEPLKSTDSSNAFSTQRARDWVRAVENAVQEWNQYLPLQVTQQAEGADIAIWRSTPPLRLERDTRSSRDRDAQSSGDRRAPGLVLGRARSAETRFDLYASRPASSQPNADQKPTLAHRFTILLRPDQTSQYLEAAARHELGHALGIWGHSPRESDALYFSQVRNPPAISFRDINTLKRIYQQPTRLGWSLPESGKMEQG